MSSIPQTFKLRGAYIELDNLLKALNFVPSGAEAKILIRTCSVKVNGVCEDKVRKKLKAGDTVETQGLSILLV